MTPFGFRCKVAIIEGGNNHPTNQPARRLTYTGNMRNFISSPKEFFFFIKNTNFISNDDADNPAENLYGSFLKGLCQ